MYVRARVRYPARFFVEFPEIDAFLVQFRSPIYEFRMAGALRFGASRSCVRGALYGGSSGGDGAGRLGDVDRGGGVAGVLRKAEEDSRGGSEEDHERDLQFRDEGFAKGGEPCRRTLCRFGVFRSG